MDQFGCSIDMEPRTLNEGEMHNAREAAMDIIQKKEPEEVSEIFTQGKRAIVSIGGIEKEASKSNQLHEVQVSKRSWGLSFNPTNSEDFPDAAKIREPLSSPF